MFDGGGMKGRRKNIGKQDGEVRNILIGMNINNNEYINKKIIISITIVIEMTRCIVGIPT